MGSKSSVKLINLGNNLSRDEKINLLNIKEGFISFRTPLTIDISYEEVASYWE